MELHVLKTAVTIVICALVHVSSGKVKYGPHFPDNMTTTCEEYSRNARFNPYAMFNETWFVFYYWAPFIDYHFFAFTPVTAKQQLILDKHFGDAYSPPINWTARHFMIWRRREMALLVENGDRGQFLLYSPDFKPKKDEKLKPMDIRFKQTGDNKVVGMLYCEYSQLYVMSRVEDVPRQKHLQEAASRLNYRGRKGKSYLYQGHEWMPIPEQNEYDFWSSKKRRRYMYG